MERTRRNKMKGKRVMLNRQFGINIVSVNKKKSLPKFDHEVGVDLSMDGILIMCTKPLRAGTTLGLDIMLVRGNSYKNIKTTGKVKRCEVTQTRPRTYSIEAKFIHMPRDNRLKIAWFLS